MHQPSVARTLQLGVPHGSERSRIASLKELLEGDLDFAIQGTVDARQSWHPFAAKFPPGLARHFIEHLTWPGDVVLDPMMGSATTLIEASTLGRESIGIDIDPLSLLLARAKFASLDPALCAEACETIILKARQRLAHEESNLRRKLTGRFDQKSLEFVEYWFTPTTQLELFALILEVETLGNMNLRLFMQLVFSACIIAKSGGVSRARDLAHTRPHRVPDKKIPSAFQEFEKKSKKICQRMKAQHVDNVRLCESRVQSLPLEDSMVDIIVTSPPVRKQCD